MENINEKLVERINHKTNFSQAIAVRCNKYISNYF